MAGSEKLIVLGHDKVEFLKRCAIKSIPTVSKIVEQIQRKHKGGKGKTPRKIEKKKKEVKEEETPKRKKKKIVEETPKPKSVAKESAKKKPPVEVSIKSSSSSSSSDSEDEKQRERERQRKREEEEEKERKKAKEDRRKRKEEKQKEKERAEKMRRIEEEAARRRRREDEEEKKRRKRKVVEDSDEEHPNIVIESATDSDVEMAKPVAPIKKKTPVVSAKKEPAQISRKSKKSAEKGNNKVKNVEGKDRKQTLLEFNCITSPQLEIKEINEFVELREMLKEYGVSEEYRRKLANFPEEQLLTCDSDACPFLLEYERPFSALYEEARRKWTPSLDTPSTAHLRSKCVTCDKTLSHVASQTWKKLLGANSFYCSVKCISGKVERVLKDSPDAETVTVMNALTGETVRGGVYSRELKSFFLLSPNWMPFSVATTIPGTEEKPATSATTKKEKRRDVSPLKEKKSLTTKIPKKSSDQTETMRMSTKQSFENALVGRAEKYRIRVERETIKEMAINIEDMLFERYDRNLSHPKYRNWKVQFLQMFEQEKAKLFVINVLTGKLTIEKIVAFEVTQLRNPQNWQVRLPRKPGYQQDRGGNSASTSRVGVSPLDAIIGDDNRDTTGEHLSHAFSKNCRICQSKQIADAQEKINKENEERDLRERREKNKARMAEMRIEEMKRKQQLKEEKLRKEQETENHLNGNGFDDDLNNDDDDYGAGAGSPGVYETDFADSFRTHRSSVEPSCSKNEEDEWRCSFRLYAGDAKIGAEAVPIFYKNDGTLPLMKLCKQVIDGRGLEIHQPLHMPQFLNESHTAMNQHRTCAIAVLKLEPKNPKDQAYSDFLEHSLKQELVGQLKINMDNEDLLSVFVYPHKGSQIVHDTLAPLKYNLETSKDCFLLLFIIKPDYAQRFEYSVRLSDPEMREQLAKCEREKMAGRSWRKPPTTEQESWRQNSSDEKKPKAARTPPKDFDMRIVAAAVADEAEEERKPKFAARHENGAREREEEEDQEDREEDQEGSNQEDETISATKTKIIMNIIDQTERICDIVDSTKDFMLDADVCEDDRIKVTQYIESRILEEKRRKKEQRKSKEQQQQQAKSNHTHTSAVKEEQTSFSLPPPQPPVFLNTSVPPPMVPPGVPFVPNAYPPYAQPPTTTATTPVAALVAPPSLQSQPQPQQLPPGVTDPKKSLPAPPRLHPAQLPPGVTCVRDARTDEQIVADAIRKGQVAPIPQALLISASLSTAPPINELMEMEKRRLMVAPAPENFPRHLIPPRFAAHEMQQQQQRRMREQNVADVAYQPPQHRRSFSPPASQRYRTPSPPPPQQQQQQQLIIDDNNGPPVENGRKVVKTEKPPKATDDLFPLRFGRNPKKRQVVPEPVVPNPDKKKRQKRARAGKKHAKRGGGDVADSDDDDDVKREDEEDASLSDNAPPPPPPPPEDTESETSDSPSPPPPPVVATAATATTTTPTIHAPIFEVNKPPAPPPLSSAPPSSVPLPVPPPPPPISSSSATATTSSATPANPSFSTLLLPPPPPPPPDTLTRQPSESPLMMHQQQHPQHPQHQNQNHNNYETEWTSSSEWEAPSTSQQQPYNQHQNYHHQNNYGAPPPRGGGGGGGPPGGNVWRGGAHHQQPLPQQAYMRGGPSPRGGGGGAYRGGPPPHFYPPPQQQQQQHGGFFGDSPRNPQFHNNHPPPHHHQQQQRGNWRGGPPRGGGGPRGGSRGSRGRGGYW